MLVDLFYKEETKMVRSYFFVVIGALTDTLH